MPSFITSKVKRRVHKKKDAENFQHYVSKWGTDNMKNEIEIYADDQLWKRKNGVYVHNHTPLIQQWQTLFYNAEKHHDENAMRTWSTILSRIYPVQEWPYQQIQQSNNLCHK